MGLLGALRGLSRPIRTKDLAADLTSGERFQRSFFMAPEGDILGAANPSHTHDDMLNDAIHAAGIDGHFWRRAHDEGLVQLGAYTDAGAPSLAIREPSGGLTDKQRTQLNALVSRMKREPSAQIYAGVYKPRDDMNYFDTEDIGDANFSRSNPAWSRYLAALLAAGGGSGLLGAVARKQQEAA